MVDQASEAQAAELTALRTLAHATVARQDALAYLLQRPPPDAPVSGEAGPQLLSRWQRLQLARGARESAGHARECISQVSAHLQALADRITLQRSVLGFVPRKNLI
jgi:hypothetical protein